MIYALFLLPFAAGLAAFWWKHDLSRRGLLVATAVVHALMTAALWRSWDQTVSYDSTQPGSSSTAWIALDATGLLFLTTISVLFLPCAIYCAGYLARERGARHVDTEEHLGFSNEPEAIFTGCMLMFLGSMTLVTLSQHFGLLWVAVEATTLASAPLIYFHRHHRSLEATWKYLLICSVGIALALLGNFLLAVAASDPSGQPPGLTLTELKLNAHRFHIPWLNAAFLFFLVGYGTKMGLAPMHTWLPDAHSESPSVASALLSGALLNCAFLGIMRAHQVCVAAGVADFSRGLLVGFGLLSMAIAGVFILNQVDFKRMLAYSSVEHMGILSFGVGIGGAAAYGSAFHALNHSLTKAALFLVAGNIMAAYKTKSVSEVRGLLHVLPISGMLWVAGFVSIIGSPPFGTFLSEFTILKGALDQGQAVLSVAYLGLLAIIFVGMAGLVLPMAQGEPISPGVGLNRREGLLEVVPPVALLLMVFILGLYVPPSLNSVLHDVARAMGGL
jgi:hydrogenase-4 component F